MKSRPSTALAVTTLGIVILGIAVPFSPLAEPLGFEPLPPAFFAFLALVTGTYLILVEIGKRMLFARLSQPRRRSRGNVAPHAQ